MKAEKSEKSEKVSRRDRSVQEQLFDDEQLLIVARPGRVATLPKYVLTLGLYGMWRKRDTSTATDQRILLGKGLVRRNETSIPLDHVDDVSVARRGLYSFVDLTIKRNGGTTYTRVGPLPPRSARKFAKEVLQHR